MHLGLLRLEICRRFFNPKSLQWRRNEGVSYNQCLGCMLNPSFRRISKKTPKLRVTVFCQGNPPVTRKKFPFDDVIMVETPITCIPVHNRIIGMKLINIVSSHGDNSIYLWGLACVNNFGMFKVVDTWYRPPTSLRPFDTFAFDDTTCCYSNPTWQLSSYHTNDATWLSWHWLAMQGYDLSSIHWEYRISPFTLFL